MYGVHRTCAAMAAVSHGITTLADIQSTVCKATFRVAYNKSTDAENSTVVAVGKHLGLILRRDPQQAFIKIK